MGKALLNYSEEEIAHMQLWKFAELMEHHKEHHNMVIKKMIYVINDAKKEQLEEKQVVYF